MLGTILPASIRNARAEWVHRPQIT